MTCSWKLLNYLKLEDFEDKKAPEKASNNAQKEKEESQTQQTKYSRISFPDTVDMLPESMKKSEVVMDIMRKLISQEKEGVEKKNSVFDKKVFRSQW